MKNFLKGTVKSFEEVIVVNKKIYYNGKRIDPESKEGKRISAKIDQGFKQMDVAFEEMDRAFESMGNAFDKMGDMFDDL